MNVEEANEVWRQEDLRRHFRNVRMIRKFACIVAKMVRRYDCKPEFDYEAFRAELRQKKTQHGEPAGSS